LWSLAAVVLIACGVENQNNVLVKNDKYFEVSLGFSTEQGVRSGGNGLGLLSGKDVRIKYSISDCKSGFKNKVDEFVSVSDLSLRFYRGDSGCKVKLDSIRLQSAGKTGFSDYSVSNGSPDSSFAVAGPAPSSTPKTYRGIGNPNQLLLVSDISFDMKNASELNFIFQSVGGDTSTKSVANVSMTQSLGTAALEAPNFEIPFDAKFSDSANNGVSLSTLGAVYSGGTAGSNEANVGFQIDVLMRCANNVSLGTGGAVNTTASCPTPAGDAMKVHDLQLAVVMCRSKDDRLTYAEAAALFSATPSSRVMSAPSSLVPVIKNGATFTSQATTDFVTGLRFEGVKTHFPSSAIAGTAIDKGCVFDQASQAKGWMILRKTEGSGSSQVSSYQVTNIELSATASVAAIATAMKEEVKIFDYTGSVESFKIPAGVTSVEIKAWGGGGCVFDETPNYAASHNADYGGAGGFSSAKISVKSDEILYIQVGQGGQKYGSESGGYPNGGDGYNGGCAGGGSSNVYVNGYGSQDKIVLVAGGGGGAGWYTPSGSSRQGNGAAGGGLIAQSGTANPGAGGNQSQGGQIGNGKGSALKGGASSGNGGTGGPGAGGGGYFGGASGVGGSNNTNGGGGGGSCYVGLASDGKVLTSNAGEGDAKDYIDAAGSTRTVGGRAYSAAECLSGNGKNSPKKSDPDYVAGIAMGGDIANVTQVPGWGASHKIAKGGNGRVVLRYMVPATPATAPVLVPMNVTGLKPTLTGTCDSSASNHTATTTLGSVRSVSCTNGVLNVVVHLPAGAASFSVTATSAKNGSSFASKAATFTRTSFTCPAGYVGVPGSGAPGLGNANAKNGHASWWLDTGKDFCVMKYPAKNVSGVAASVAEGTPWVNVTRNNSVTTCAAAVAGGNYRLISNTQWQTVARNAESVAANWSGNAVGSGLMARGHTDNSPANVLANSSDNDPYYGTGNSAADALGVGWEQRRTQTLSNGEVVWDFGGNISQWVSDSYADLGVNPTIATGMDEFSNASNFPTVLPSINRLLFAPLGLYNSTQNVGAVYGYTGLVSRGMSFSIGTNAGLFAASLGGSSSGYNPDLGFRCAHPGVSPIDFADTTNGATLPGTTPNGANVNANYFGPSAYDLSMNSNLNVQWPAVGALVSDATTVNTMSRPNKYNHNGSTWRVVSPNNVAYMVIDLGQTRTFSKAHYFQMFSDGKTTHAAMDISATLRGYADAGWTPVHAEQLMANGNDSNPSTTADLIASFNPVTGRYVRLQLRNDGRYGSPSYIELFKVKIFE